MKLLDPNPDLRISSEQALKHIYFKDDGMIIKDLLKQNQLFMASKVTSKTRSNKMTSFGKQSILQSKKFTHGAFQNYQSRPYLNMKVEPE